MKHVRFFVFSMLITYQTDSQNLIIAPNPFVHNALATYTITQNDTVSLNIVDITAKEVLSVLSHSLLSAGVYQDSIILKQFPPGIYFAMLTTKSGSTSTQKLVKIGSTGLPLFEHQYNINVLPNPVKDRLLIEVGDVPGGIMKLKIVNALGQIVLFKQEVREKEELDLGSFAPDMYYLIFSEESGVQSVYRVVKE